MKHHTRRPEGATIIPVDRVPKEFWAQSAGHYVYHTNQRASPDGWMIFCYSGNVEEIYCLRSDGSYWRLFIDLPNCGYGIDERNCYGIDERLKQVKQELALIEHTLELLPEGEKADLFAENLFNRIERVQDELCALYAVHNPERFQKWVAKRTKERILKIKGG